MHSEGTRSMWVLRFSVHFDVEQFNDGDQGNSFSRFGHFEYYSVFEVSFGADHGADDPGTAAPQLCSQFKPSQQAETTFQATRLVEAWSTFHELGPPGVCV